MWWELEMPTAPAREGGGGFLASYLLGRTPGCQTLRTFEA
jgi:hypothetical protein